MKNATRSKELSRAEVDTGIIPLFTGSSNPRHLLAISALLRGPLRRERLDEIAECSNGPDIIYRLRKRSLDIVCIQVEKGRGVYCLTALGHRQIAEWRNEK